MAMNLQKLKDAASAARNEMESIAAQIVDLTDKDQVDEALKLQDKLTKAKADAKAANDLYLSVVDVALAGNSDENGTRFVPTASNRQEPKDITEMRASKEYGDKFWDAFRNGVTPTTIKNGQHSGEKFGILMDSISETGGSPVGEDGGFLNPVDFDNKIIELMRKYVDLSQYCSDEPVTAYSGWRVIEQFAASLPLTDMVELAVLDDGDEGESPKFNKIEYTLADKGDFLRVSNSQMQDTPVSLMTYLAKWFSKKLILTRNALILAKINAISATDVAAAKDSLKAIKTVLNKTLDPAFSASANIYTNASGLDVLDSLVDGTGRPMLQPNPTNATQLMFKSRPIIHLSDAHWANVTSPATRARIAIGDLEEFLLHFHRPMFEFASTNIGGSAWRSNSSEVRGIARLDVETADSGACALLTTALS